ncbi:MAG: ribosomal-processing cysteine protease Prp [Clostridia bacterium]|nr:ribosomal-processing cysteine protease Prp [Clostridia bacterium]
MIKARIFRDKTGLIRGFCIEGHAGYGKKGSDIVCAAVSAIAYTAVGALDELAGIRGFSEEDGHMACSLPQDLSFEAKEKAEIILKAMYIGLKQVEYSYKKFVSVLDEEV